jgi:hypothetical protein
VSLSDLIVAVHSILFITIWHFIWQRLARAVIAVAIAAAAAAAVTATATVVMMHNDRRSRSTIGELNTWEVHEAVRGATGTEQHLVPIILYFKWIDRKYR